MNIFGTGLTKFCSHQNLSIYPKKVCHAHFNDHKPPKPVTPTIFMLDKSFMVFGLPLRLTLVNTYRLTQKNLTGASNHWHYNWHHRNYIFTSTKSALSNIIFNYPCPTWSVL